MSLDSGPPIRSSSPPAPERANGRRARRGAVQLLRRRWRATWRLVRVDAPTLWRMASHVAVLVLSLGVVLATRWAPATGTRETGSAPMAAAALSAVADARAGVFRMPDPVLGTSGQEARRGSNVEPVQAAGFMSPGVIAEANRSLLPWDEPRSYIVQQNDTLSGIAASFGVAPEKLLQYNPALRDDPHNLSIGDELTILPIDGVVHVVEEGETLTGIAADYEVAVEDIVAYTPNGLGGTADPLSPARKIVVPGAEIEVEIGAYLPRFKEFPTWALRGGGGPAAGPASFHIATFGRRTQGFWSRHPAIDLAAPTGTPIYAIDSATVAQAGWLGWAGYGVILDHGNGYRSLFAHMHSVSVSNGQHVQRGQIIGTVGCTRGLGGRCTGPHLHLEVYRNGAPVNPCAVGACP